jgi:hypothetical protein
MIYRADQRVWDLVRDKVIAFTIKWHRPGTIDRAVRFMIMTSRPDFADQIWPLISHTDAQIHLYALRAARRFRPSVLGSNALERLAPLPDDIREAIISELAIYGGSEGIELAASLARADPSANVQARAVSSLFFRRADRNANELMRSAHEAVWSILAQTGYVDEFADTDVLKRLRTEQQQVIESEPDPVKKLGIILNSQENVDQAPSELVTVLESLEFFAGDQQASRIAAAAFKRYPQQVALAFVHRLENRMELPFHGGQYLRDVPAVDSGPLHEAVLDAHCPPSVTNVAATLIGSSTIVELINRLFACQEKLLPTPPYDQILTGEFHRLKGLIAKARTASFIDAWLEYADTTNPHRITLLADLFAHYFRHASAPIAAAFVPSVGTTLETFGQRLLASPHSRRYQFAEMAEAIAAFPQAELLPILTRLLTEDLRRWLQLKEEHKVALARGTHLYPSEAATSWTPQYARALAAIGGDDVAKLMEGYLMDRQFGIEAARVLKAMWDQQQPQKDSLQNFTSWHDFSDVKARRRERKQGAIVASPFSATIFAAVEALITPGSDAEAHRHALQLAPLAFSMPYIEKTELIARLIAISQPMRQKLPLLAVLVRAGEIVEADVIIAGLKEQLADAEKSPWRLDRDYGELDSWLELLPFGDRPQATLDALEILPPQRRLPARIGRLLKALRNTPDQQSEQILAELCQRDPGFFAQYEWGEALLGRRTVTAIFLFIDAVRQAQALPTHAYNIWSLSEKIASLVRDNSEAKAEILRRYVAERDGLAKNVLEAIVAKLADPDALMTIIRNYSAHSKPFDSFLRSAIEAVAVGQRSVPDWANAYERFSVEIPQLRKQLFSMLASESDRELASACLTTIDELRDQHGRTDAEPRHPDIESGRPWPVEAAL